MSKNNEWQAFINQGLDENWDYNEEEDEIMEIFKGVQLIKSNQMLDLPPTIKNESSVDGRESIPHGIFL
jgi:hypothetical protein